MSYGVCMCTCGPPAYGVCNACGAAGRYYQHPYPQPAAPVVTPTGWQCPNCKRCYAPGVLTCFACIPVKTTITGPQAGTTPAIGDDEVVEA